MNTEVLVVGAGPVGLTMAGALKRRGVEVRIVDRAAEPSRTSKALVLWSRTLELLDIEGCVAPFLDAGLRGTGTRILANGHELVRVTLDTAGTPYNFALLLPQSETERLLGLHLERLGVSVERNVALQTFADDGAGVTATLAHADGRIEAARCGFLIGCDGAHSAVRHGLGVPFDGVTAPSHWMLADVRIDGALPGREITLCWRPDGILALFPITEGRFRVIADVRAADVEAGGASAEALTLADIQHALDTRGPGGLRAHDPVWLSRFRINERKVRDYRRGRVFLAGDAAHIHSPAGGQGMNTGMQDALNLAWKLALACRGRAGEALLDSYSPERSAIGAEVLRNASRMTEVAILHNPILKGLRNLAVGALGHVPALRQRLVDQLTELDLHYEGGPLTVQGGGRPAAGHRAPDVALEAPASTRLYEVLRPGGFALLSVGLPGPQVPDDLAPVLRAAIVAANEPAYAAGHHLLVRPDGYVAAVAGEPDPLFAHLRRILAR